MMAGALRVAVAEDAMYRREDIRDLLAPIIKFEIAQCRAKCQPDWDGKSDRRQAGRPGRDGRDGRDVAVTTKQGRFSGPVWAVVYLGTLGCIVAMTWMLKHGG